jgi:two-component system nitrate/nitrite response regulator NarL
MATLSLPAEIDTVNGIVRIVIADSHAMFRAALRHLFRTKPDFHLIAEAEDGVAAIAIVRKVRPHVVLLDLELPRCSGLDALREICVASPDTLPLLLVDDIDDEVLIEALCLGARGVTLKTTAPELLFKSIRAIVGGEYWLERSHFPVLIRALNNRSHSRGNGNGHNTFGLNQHELELVAAIADGESTRDLAEKFSLSEVTIRHQLTNVFRKLRVRNRGELVSFALRNDLGSNGKSDGKGNGSRQLTGLTQARSAA